MLGKRPELVFQTELIDINGEFLALATDSRVSGCSSLFGLPGSVLGALRDMDPEQLAAVAGAPLLLAEFLPLPGLSQSAVQVEDVALPAGLPASWLHDADGFANRLLTCIWQATRQNRLLTSFCLGIDHSQQRAFADLSFSQISQSSNSSLQSLRMRLARHQTFWTDLIETVRRGSDEQLMACRLAMIPLSVVPDALPTSTAACPRYF